MDDCQRLGLSGCVEHVHMEGARIASRTMDTKKQLRLKYGHHQEYGLLLDANPTFRERNINMGV